MSSGIAFFYGVRHLIFQEETMKTKTTLSFGAVATAASLALSALVGFTTVTAANAADKSKLALSI